MPTSHENQELVRRTDLQLFPNISRPYWLNKVLKNNEVAVVSVVNCLMRRNLTRIDETINIPEIFSGVYGFTGKTFTGNSRLSVRSHVVAGANERRLHSQARKDGKACISKTHNILQFN